MNLRDLEYLVALEEEKHFRKAAERCFVSQPTLSGQLRKSLSDNPKTLRLVQLTESNIRKLEPELTRLKPGMPDYQQIMMTLAPLQEPLSYSLASMMQKNINVYSGNDKRFGQLRDALLTLAGSAAAGAFMWWPFL